jgi:hypothetical protein
VRADDLLGLLTDLEAHGAVPVRHGEFVGLTGGSLTKLPADLWGRFARLAPRLRRLLKNSPSPFRRRAQRHGAGDVSADNHLSR